MIEQFLVWKPARGGVYSVHGGDDCLTEERSHLATHNGPFMGLPATGKSIEVNGLELFRPPRSPIRHITNLRAVR